MVKAPEVTRQRMYLDTMQQVFANTSKVMVDAKGQGNLLYLPLDKMIEGRNGKSTPATGSAAAASTNNDAASHVSTDLPQQPRTRESR